MTGLLRFRDLKEYGVNNWPTLGRWIREEGFPTGFYLAANTRAWSKEECDAWLASRPKADPPPENASAVNSCSTRSDGGAIDTSAGRQSNPRDRRIESIQQAFPNGRADR